MCIKHTYLKSKDNTSCMQKPFNIFNKDPIFNSFWITKFSKKFMRAGNRARISSIVKKSLIKSKMSIKRLPVYTLFGMILRTRPILDIISRRKGKKYLDVPVPLSPRRQLIKSLSWIIIAIKTRRVNRLDTRISAELIANSNNQKTAVFTKHKTFSAKLREARINIHYRWK